MDEVVSKWVGSKGGICKFEPNPYATVFENKSNHIPNLHLVPVNPTQIDSVIHEVRPELSHTTWKMYGSTQLTRPYHKALFKPDSNSRTIWGPLPSFSCVKSQVPVQLRTSCQPTLNLAWVQVRTLGTRSIKKTYIYFAVHCIKTMLMLHINIFTNLQS